MGEIGSERTVGEIGAENDQTMNNRFQLVLSPIWEWPSINKPVAKLDEHCPHVTPLSWKFKFMAAPHKEIYGIGMKFSGHVMKTTVTAYCAGPCEIFINTVFASKW